MSAAAALRETVTLAQYAEEWGYQRFWVSEHHHNQRLAGSSPEVLAAYLLAKTHRIQIGSGGVMLQHYSPFKVAEVFHVLAGLEPDRVDLGIGKGSGGFPLTTEALLYSRYPVKDRISFEEKFHFLNELLNNNISRDSIFASLEATPLPAQKPACYLLGASVDSACMAAQYQWNFVYKGFLQSDARLLAEVSARYKQIYPDGRFFLVVPAVAAATAEAAQALVQDYKAFKVHFNNGTTATVEGFDQAHAYGKAAETGYEISEEETNVIAGTPSQVKQTLDYLHEQYEVDAFILHTPVQSTAERMQSIKLLSPKYMEQELETTLKTST